MRFITITKPGIIFGNIITVTGGFCLALQGRPFDFLLFITTLIGMSLVMACGCVFNNCIDRDIDRLMERTKDRPLANGQMTLMTAITYAIVLGMVGALVLFIYSNLLTLFIAVIGLFFYVVVYSLWMKRQSVYGTAVGGIAGAVPPVVGYCAVTNRFDLGAVLLFLILFFWQIPHSYAIAINRLNDYVAAKIPVLPVKQGIHITKLITVIFVVLFAVSAIMPFVFEYAGWFYFIVALVLSLIWLFYALKAFACTDDRQWARTLFLISILVITLLMLAMLLPIL